MDEWFFIVKGAVTVGTICFYLYDSWKRREGWRLTVSGGILLSFVLVGFWGPTFFGHPITFLASAVVACAIFIASDRRMRRAIWKGLDSLDEKYSGQPKFSIGVLCGAMAIIFATGVVKELRTGAPWDIKPAIDNSSSANRK